jgi:hypothetical protein
MRSPFSLVRHLFIGNTESKCAVKRRAGRVASRTPTEFVFCNRTFGAVILDASNSGVKLCCDIRLGIGSIITLAEPAISGKIVWRDDNKHLMGVKFIKNA